MPVVPGSRRMVAPVRRLVATALCLRMAGLALAAAPVFALAVLVGALTGPTLGPPTARATRWLPDLVRRLSARPGTATIARPYRTEPAGGRGMAGYRARVAWMWTDPATWRDLAWLAAEPVVGTVLLLPGVAVLFAWIGLLVPGVEGWAGRLYGFDGAPLDAASAVAGALLIVLGVLLAPAALGWHARWCARLLAPTDAARLRLERDRLARRVDRLSASRADATDYQATELRRIERDLHDGAQARLAAVAITLGAAEQLLDTDPGRARELYGRARQSTQTALEELRDLVNGIHPPVLAERGLADALRSLVLESGLRVTVVGDLPGRPPDPVCSAAYFTTCELIANVAKHAGGAEARVEIEHRDGQLRLTVRDDGPGGADPARGNGLAGIGRRLGTFDGTLRLTSPAGGPTIAVVEVPCELSSPKTTNC
ncbi:sensor domain-containing protein [Rugosimonospora acidiphila]|uniref:histidine kinase n=1 Tax=Rugosimonospora acidiphila TaxID=556531 RepID=A0ABP9SSM2_9ACTN